MALKNDWSYPVVKANPSKDIFGYADRTLLLMLITNLGRLRGILALCQTTLIKSRYVFILQHIKTYVKGTSNKYYVWWNKFRILSDTMVSNCALTAVATRKCHKSRMSAAQIAKTPLNCYGLSQRIIFLRPINIRWSFIDSSLSLSKQKHHLLGQKI